MQMSITLFSALLVGCAPKASAPVVATVLGPQVELPCDWPAGASFTYDHLRKRTDSRKPLLAGVETHTPLVVTVERAGNPTSVTYALGESQVTGPEAAVAAIRALETSIPPLRLTFTDGAVSDLENQQEVVDAMAPVLAAAVASGDENTKRATEATLALMREPAGKQMLMRDPARFFAMHCVVMNVGQVIEAPIAFPNPFGGAPLSGTSRIEVSAFDAAAGTITFLTHDTMAPGAANAALDGMIKRFAPGEVTPEKRAEILAQVPPIESEMTGRMVYSVADGFPLSVDIHQEIGNEDHGLRRTDDWIWTRTSR